MSEVLITTRCRLDPIKRDHIADLHSLWTLPEVRKFLWDDEVIPLSLTEELVEKSIFHSERSEYGLWLVHLVDGNECIGFGGFWPFHEPERIELVFGLSPRYWGQGYATEIAKKLIQFGKEKLSINSILASTDAPNKASIAVLQQLGMEQTHIRSETNTCFFHLKE